MAMGATILMVNRRDTLFVILHKVAYRPESVFRGVEFREGREVEGANYSDADPLKPVLRLTMTPADFLRDFDFHEHALGYGLDA